MQPKMPELKSIELNSSQVLLSRQEISAFKKLQAAISLSWIAMMCGYPISLKIS
jgi:hypothetical protein